MSMFEGKVDLELNEGAFGREYKSRHSLFQ